MTNRNKGLFFAFISAVLYGTIPLFDKIFVHYFHPLFVALGLTFIVDLYFLIVCLFRRDFLKNFMCKEIIWVVMLGIFAAIGSILVFSGLLSGKASHAGFFFQFETFFASILAFFVLKEKLNKKQIKGLICMFAGAYIFITSFSYSFETTSLFFLGSAFVWGANDVIVRSKIKHFSPFFLAFGRNFFSLCILLPIAIRYVPENLQKVSFENLIYFLIYGLVVAGTILLLYIAFRYVKIVEAISYQTFSPVVAAVSAFFILGERLSGIQIIGGAVILFGLYLTTRGLPTKETQSCSCKHVI